MTLKLYQKSNIDFVLLENSRLILGIISSGRNIHVDKFSNLCDETARRFVELYDWNPMTPTN